MCRRFKSGLGHHRKNSIEEIRCFFITKAVKYTLLMKIIIQISLIQGSHLILKLAAMYYNYLYYLIGEIICKK